MTTKNSPTNAEVLVVHCVDTEGVFFEGLEATFGRIRDALGIKVEATYENLSLLRKNQYPGVNVTPAMQEFFSERQTSFIEDLHHHAEMIQDLMVNYRNQLKDSYGNGYIWNWHILDFVGFETNPRRRLVGDHVLFDLFQGYIAKHRGATEIADTLQWHYHHPPVHGEGNKSGLNWYHGGRFDYVLSRKIIDRRWFPTVFRPGEHIETNDISFWLNKWFPFDYAARSIDPKYGYTQVDDDGRRHNWKKAPTTWGSYHPSYDDYQAPGTMKRSIARILDVKSRAYSICDFEVEKAFKQVKSNQQSTILAVMNHDIRDMRPEHSHFMKILEKTSKLYPDVKFRYCTGVEAFRAHLGLKQQNPIKIGIEYLADKKQFVVKTDRAPFGLQPYFCFKSLDGRYVHEPMYSIAENTWAYYVNFEPALIETVGVACNDDTGNTSVINYDFRTKEKTEKLYDYRR